MDAQPCRTCQPKAVSSLEHLRHRPGRRVLLKKRSRYGTGSRNPVSGDLRKKDLHADPFQQFAKWFQEAEAAGIEFANAMTLAMASKDAVPSARMVLLKDVDARGFVFYTNYESPKARDLEEKQQAALVIYWQKLERQVRIAGSIAKTSRGESGRYFRTRPRESQAAAWISKQSEVITSRRELEERFEAFMRHHDGKDIPLPPHWGGYRLLPRVVEFWQGGANRLHDRLRYIRLDESTWRVERLSP